MYLSPMLDKKTIHHVDGVVTTGTNNMYRMPVTLFLWGLPQHKADVIQRCRLGGLRVGAPDPVAAAVMEEAPAAGQMTPIEKEDALDQLFARLEADKQSIRTMEPAAAVTAPLYPHQKVGDQ